MKSLSLAIVTVVGLLVGVVRADEPDALRLAKIFNDNMVLQQQKPIRVWGWARPGANVAVTLTQDQQLGGTAMAKFAERTGNRPAAPKDDDNYSVTVRYVEKNPMVHRTLQRFG